MHTGGYCAIVGPELSSATSDFDRRTTLELLAGLSDAARADRDHLKAGDRTDVGKRLEELSPQLSPRVFVSAGAAELATRLRQLDCAVRAERLDFAQAEQTYGKILADLSAERATLEPATARR